MKTDYIKKYSVSQNKRNSLSVFNANMRTTSSLESVNSVLGRSFPLHPHLFKFIENLQLFEFSKSLDMLELVASNAPVNHHQRRRERDQGRENKIRYFTRKLQDEDDVEFDVGCFLEAMACKDNFLDYSKCSIYLLCTETKQR